MDFKMAHFIFLDKSDLQGTCSVIVLLEVGFMGIINGHPFIKDTYSRESWTYKYIISIFVWSTVIVTKIIDIPEVFF